MTTGQHALRSLSGAAALIALLAAGAATAQTFEITPGGDVLQGRPVAVRLTGVAPGQAVEISAERRFGRPEPMVWRSSAAFTADLQGEIDLTADAATGGTYDGVDAAGLFWSMTPTPTPAPADWRTGEVRLTATVDGQVVATVRPVSSAPCRPSRRKRFPASRRHVPGLALW